jgi:hypothetical protein
MATYQTKSSVSNVEAVRLTQELAAAPLTWPQFLTDAWNKLPSEAGAAYLASNGFTGGSTELFLFLNHTNAVPIRVAWGSYFVLDGDGNLTNLSELAFDSTYDIVA